MAEKLGFQKTGAGTSLGTVEPAPPAQTDQDAQKRQGARVPRPRPDAAIAQPSQGQGR